MKCEQINHYNIINLCEFGLEMRVGLGSILVTAIQWLLHRSHEAKMKNTFQTSDFIKSIHT